MKHLSGRILMMMLLVTEMVAYAQFDPKKVCRIDDGRVIFTLDRRWSATQRKEIGRIFDLDSTLLSEAFALKPVISENGFTWKTRSLDANHVELSRAPGKPSAAETSKEQIFLMDDRILGAGGSGENWVGTYGVNRLTRNTVVQLAANRVRFFLPGHLNAKKVFLSGSFNAWSTLQTPMEACDSGWTITLKLKPGHYAYKFITDGKWINDPYNKLREEDTYHGYNNIFFCYNHRFALNGYPEAHRVVVAGSFNNWNKSELQMVRFRGSWVINLYLKEGTHAYKFIVDGKWMTDPANKITRPDGMGNMNSFMAIGDTLFFRLAGYPRAKKVIVSGDFNVWNQEELSMAKTRDGWQLPYVLGPGNYAYKFIVDGEWIADPSNPYIVDNAANSYLSVKPNYWFRLEQNSDAGKVIVAGSFNNWNEQGYRMDLKQGTWWFPVFLRPGKYTYKFIVDGKWILDPGNELWEDNEYGTGNSVLWIGQ